MILRKKWSIYWKYSDDIFNYFSSLEEKDYTHIIKLRKKVFIYIYLVYRSKYWRKLKKSPLLLKDPLFNKEKADYFNYSLDSVGLRFKLKRHKRFFKKKQNNIKFRIFFGNLKNYQLKNLIKSINKFSFLKNKSLIALLELRVDVLLVKLKFFDNIEQVREQITNKDILIINKRIINNPGYLLKVGDSFTITEKYKEIFYKKIIEKKIIFPYFIEFNYKILSGYIIELPDDTNITKILNCNPKYLLTN